MKALNLKIAVSAALALTLGLSACTKQDDSSNDGRVKITATEEMDAEELALAGEQLFSPYTFMLANKIFDMALAKDANNKRAQFYKAFLALPMTMKGYVKRVKPLVRKNNNIGNWDKWIAESPESPLKSFLLDGAEDIETAADVQAKLLDPQLEATRNLRSFLKANQSMELTLNLNPDVFKGYLEKSVWNQCEVSEMGTPGVDYNYSVKCDWSNYLTRKVNSADMVALTQAAAGYQLFYTMYNSYSISGAEKLEQESKNQVWTSEQKIKFLSNIPEFGVLKAKNYMSEVTALGADGIAAARWAIQYQSSLCPQSKNPSFTTNKIRRKGFLFNEGICVDTGSEVEKKLALAEQGLSGVIKLTVHTADNQEVETNVDPLVLFRKPIANLRDVAPTEYNACGDAAKLKDSTFGGMYPNGDAEKILAKKCN